MTKLLGLYIRVWNVKRRRQWVWVILNLNQQNSKHTSTQFEVEGARAPVPHSWWRQWSHNLYVSWGWSWLRRSLGGQLLCRVCCYLSGVSGYFLLGLCGWLPSQPQIIADLWPVSVSNYTAWWQACVWEKLAHQGCYSLFENGLSNKEHVLSQTSSAVHDMWLCFKT